MSKSLFVQAISKFTLGLVLTGLLLFGPAGTLAFWNGWLLMVILFVPMFFVGVVLMIKNPQLLQSRLKSREKLDDQDAVVKLSALMFLCGFAAAGLNYRFRWSALPRAVSAAGAVLFLLAYLLYAEVLRENTYLSRIIEVQENQKVIDTGLYAVVRHPMYSATLLLFLSMPLVLGSLPSLFLFLLYPFLIARRIKSEEALLLRELDGYPDYRNRVKYRLVPFVW